MEKALHILKTILLITTSSFLHFTLVGQIPSQDLSKLNYTEIDSLAKLYTTNKEFGKVAVLFEAARINAKQNKQDSIYAAYTTYLGRFYLGRAEYKQALTLYTESKNIREALFGNDHPQYANSLNNLASLHIKMGNPELALPFALETLDIDEKTLGTNHPYFASSSNSLAKIYNQLGQFELALSLCLRAKKIYTKIKDEVGQKEKPKILSSLASSLNNIAFTYVNMGNFELALPLYLQAEDVYKSVFGANHPAYGMALNNLAGVHLRMKNYALAKPLFIQAKNLAQEYYGNNHPKYSLALNNLAGFYIEEKKYNTALPLLEEAIIIQEKVLGNQNPRFAKFLGNLADVHMNLGNNTLAEPLFIRAKNIIELQLGSKSPTFSINLNRLIKLYIKTGNYSSASKYIQKMLSINTGLNISLNINKPWADSLLNASYLSNNNIEHTISALENAYDLLEEEKKEGQSYKNKQLIISNLATALLAKLQNKHSHDGAKLRMLSQSTDWLQKSLELLDTQNDAAYAFQLAEQNKSVLLLNATRSEQAYQLGNLPDSLILKDKRNIKRREALEAKLYEKRPKREKDSLRTALNQVNLDIENFVALLRKDYPKYIKLKGQQVNNDPKEIQKLLDNQTALLEYVISDSTLYIFYIDHQNLRLYKQPLQKKVLAKKIKQFHSCLSNYSMIVEHEEDAYQKYRTLAHWFYQNLVAPGLKEAQNINNLVIVSDGDLGHLPFETFLMEDAPQTYAGYSNLDYLINSYNVSYNYSATLWKENEESPTPSNNGKILGMAANYETKIDTNLKTLRLPTDEWLRSTLAPLPAARKEVEVLANKFQGFFAFDSLASERTIKEKAPEYAIIHLATHGLLNHKRPVLSSIAFTENGDSIENNFLQAYEISKMKLNADLVVLSACETGYGKFEKGNGIASLARAFMYAGSPALVVSLWQVNDQVTSSIMQNLYDNLANGMKKDKALSTAKLDYIKGAKGIAAHPAFWSPFVQIGKTSAVNISRKGDTPIWAIGLGVGLLVFFGGIGFAWAKRRRKLELA
ncbi:MAG: CHAT domain-containing protein [Aureispira sp.]|nr:CHAT domain-containing protein [Aureispira sp.]